MYYLKISIGIFLVLAASRFIPHPPNFTSLMSLGFYVPVLFGIKFIPAVLLSFIVTDLFIGFHSTILFTWGSIIFIGLIANYFNKSVLNRIVGSIFGCCIFFIISNFGVWSLGTYGYTASGLILCYTLAIPFFSYSIISTIIFSSIIEAVYNQFRVFRNY